MKYSILFWMVVLAGCGRSVPYVKDAPDNDKQNNYENTCALRVVSNMLAAAAYKNESRNYNPKLQKLCENIYLHMVSFYDGIECEVNRKRSTRNVLSRALIDDQLTGRCRSSWNDFDCVTTVSVDPTTTHAELLSDFNDRRNIIALILTNYETEQNNVAGLHSVNAWKLTSKKGKLEIRITDSNDPKGRFFDEEKYKIGQNLKGEWQLMDYPFAGHNVKLLRYIKLHKSCEDEECNKSFDIVLPKIDSVPSKIYRYINLSSYDWNTGEYNFKDSKNRVNKITVKSQSRPCLVSVPTYLSIQYVDTNNIVQNSPTLMLELPYNADLSEITLITDVFSLGAGKTAHQFLLTPSQDLKLQGLKSNGVIIRSVLGSVNLIMKGFDKNAPLVPLEG